MPTHITVVNQISSMSFEGDWDPNSGSFPANADTGATFRVSTAGVLDSESFRVDELIMSTVTQIGPDENLEYSSTTTWSGNWMRISAPGEGTLTDKGTWAPSSGVFPGLGIAKQSQLYRASDSGTIDGQPFIEGQFILALQDNASTTTYASNWQIIGGGANAVLATDTDTSTYAFVVDEDNMASDLDTKIPTQQSVKAYVDSRSFSTQTPVTASATATAGQTVFTMASAPSVAFVWINGLAQEPQEYYINGSNVILNTGAALNDDVKILYLENFNPAVPNRDGWIEYADASTTAAPVVFAANTWTTVPNDGLGADSLDAYQPDGVPVLMDTTTGAIDATAANIGDELTIRNNYTITPSVNFSTLEFRYQMGTGASTYTQEKTIAILGLGAGVAYPDTSTDCITLRDANTRNNPIVLQVRCSSAAGLINLSTKVSLRRR